MRPQKNRSRGRGGHNPNNPNNPNNNPNRQRGPHRPQTFDSNGPNVKIRGNAYQVFERYIALAREAAASGDRIAAENLYQHAEHYYRIMNANGEGFGNAPRPTTPADNEMGMGEPEQAPGQGQPQHHHQQNQHGHPVPQQGYEHTPPGFHSAEPEREPGADRPRDDRPRDDRPRDPASEPQPF